MHSPLESDESWKWEKVSKTYKEKFKKLIERGRERPDKIKEICSVRVCFEEGFLIGKGGQSCGIYVGLGRDGSEKAVKRFLKDTQRLLAEKEKELLIKCKNKELAHVVKYWYFDDTSNDDFAYLIMELCEETLENFVRRNSQDNLVKVAPHVIRQILKGLADLHHEPDCILHRDVKPLNILRNSNGKWLLADFGIGRILSDDKTTHNSVERGTKKWKAVESCSKSGTSDDGKVRYKAKSDIQVTGMVAFYILTGGKHPFGENERQILFNLLAANPVNLKMLDGHPFAKDLISWMLSHDPDYRPSAEEALQHPYLKSKDEQFKLLCGIGNEHHVKTNDANSDVVKELNKDTSDWKTRIESEVLTYLSYDKLRKKSFNYTSLWTQCLRLIRNIKEHWEDVPRTESEAIKIGDPQEYFLNLFPDLVLRVYKIARSRDTLKELPGVKEYFRGSQEETNDGKIDTTDNKDPINVPENNSPVTEVSGVAANTFKSFKHIYLSGKKRSVKDVENTSKDAVKHEEVGNEVEETSTENMAEVNDAKEAMDESNRKDVENTDDDDIKHDESDTAKMKPFPCDQKALMKEATSLGLLGPNPNLKKPRAKLLDCIYSSMKIKRSFDRVSILLVGPTGVGKSSTVNHLFKRDVALTGETESVTRSTKEFLVQSDSSNYEVKGLSLGLIETPGFFHTNGSKQEACNLLSIKRFFDTHPKMKNCYPNLVFLVMTATDKRFIGENSDLAKSLRCVKKLNLVDHDNPNVVAILTHVSSIQKRTPEEWATALNKLKSKISQVVFKDLKVFAPVILIENDFEACGLERSGDFTRLRNGELQPKNLYLACADALEKNNDKLGLITLNSFYKESENGDTHPVKPGHEVEAKDAKDMLDNQEQDMLNFVETGAKTESKDAYYSKVMQYVDEKKIDSDKQQVMKLAAILKRLGEGNPPNFGSHSICSFEYFLNEEISATGRQMLREKFKVAEDTSHLPLDSARLIGQGYNILTDKSVAAQVMKFDVTTKYGIAIPTCAKFEKVEQSRSFMEEFDDEESFTRSRLKSLSVNLNVERDTFKMDYRAGYNRSKTTSSPSFLLEQRLFELKLGNYREYLDRGMTFTEDFKEDVAMLPPTYEESDPTCVRKFQRFFNRFGYYMVTSAYGGGSVEVKCGRDTVGSENTSLEQMKVSLDAVLGGLDVAKGNVSAGSRIVDGQKTKALLEQSSFSWQGGDAALQTKETIGDKKKLQKWKDSLIQNPVMLTSELTLDPISNVVGCIDDAKGDATDVALRDILNSNNIRQKRKVPPKTPLIQDANTREGTVRDPKPSAICFPSGSVVQVQSKDGEVKQKKMANLDVGDKVMAWDEKRNKAVFSKVMMFAHLAPDAMAVEYLKITLEDGNKITLSDNHLVMVGKQKKAVLARKVKPGDILFSVDENREISPKKVLAVEKVVEQGIYCPITVHGNVIVDNVLASCYASVEDHVLLKGVVKISAQSMAHLGLMPMRALHKLRSKWLRKIPNGQTIHPYLQWLCKLNLPWMAN